MSEVDGVLAHYGVKGMRWGHRTAKPPKHNKTRDYNSRDRLADVGTYGEKGTVRIERHIAGGKNIKQARKKEGRRQMAIGASFIAGYAAIRLGPGLVKMGAAIANNNKNAAFAAKAYDTAATNAFINSHGLTNYKTLIL